MIEPATTVPALPALDALLERLTAEPRPSRELDARVHHALFPEQTVLLDPGSVRPPAPPVYGPLASFPMDGWTDWDSVASAMQAGFYTRSMDAVSDLVDRVLPGALVETEFTHDWSWVAVERCEGACAGRRNPVAVLLALLGALRAVPDARPRPEQAPPAPEMVFASVTVDERILGAHGEYTQDAVIGEVVGELVGRLRRLGHDHTAHEIVVRFGPEPA